MFTAMFTGRRVKNETRDVNNRERDVDVINVNEGGISQWKRHTSTSSSEGEHNGDTRQNDYCHEDHNSRERPSKKRMARILRRTHGVVLILSSAE